jgi:hypothetical protein
VNVTGLKMALKAGTCSTYFIIKTEFLLSDWYINLSNGSSNPENTLCPFVNIYTVSTKKVWPKINKY